MKPLLVNTFDGRGGAARAASRLLAGLRATGIEAEMLVQERESDTPGARAVGSDRYAGARARLRMQLDPQPLRTLHPRRRRVPHSLNWLPGPAIGEIEASGADLVNLHWINAGFLRLESLTRIQVPVVLTMHDMWPITGLCHYDDGCLRYLEGCGRCPQLRSARTFDLSSWCYERKRRVYEALPLTVITPSGWLAEKVRESPLLGDRRIHVIPNGLDLESFRPHPAALAREVLGLPQGRKLALFGGDDPIEDDRKGFALAHEALARAESEVDLVIFGTRRPAGWRSEGLRVHFLGPLRDDTSLALAYSAADFMLSTPRQDNLPNTVMEAQACGTPVVALTRGGLPEMIDHRETGCLANGPTGEGLAAEIDWILGEDRAVKAGVRARAAAERRHGQALCAKRYTALFEAILTERVESLEETRG